MKFGYTRWTYQNAGSPDGLRVCLFLFGYPNDPDPIYMWETSRGDRGLLEDNYPASKLLRRLGIGSPTVVDTFDSDDHRWGGAAT